MKQARQLLFLFVAAMIVSLASLPTVLAAEAVDWGKGMITVVGMGIAAPGSVNVLQAQATAKRAATVDGYRQLAEIVNGVNVDSESTVENMMLVSDVTRTKVSALIKGARIIDERYAADGSCQVTMTIPMYGVSDSLAAAVLPRHSVKEPFPAPTTGSREAYSPAVASGGNSSSININIDVNHGYTGRAYYYPPYYGSPSYPPYPNYFPITPAPPAAPTAPTTPTAPAAPAEPNYNNANTSAVAIVGDYTSVVIDCTGLGLKPAMSPVIKNETGVSIYGSKNLDYDLVTAKGMAAYSRSLDVSEIPRAGDKPLVVKATAVEGHSVNPIVSASDANRILSENEQSHFLDDMNVIFVR